MTHHTDIGNGRGLFREGHNCWRIATASRATVLIDCEAYFDALRSACAKAEHSLFILGWDFDRLERLGRDEDAPTMEEFLTGLVKRKPNLHIFLLLWDFHLVYAAEREWFQAWKLRYKSDSRFHVHYDGAHPEGGSQHQKLVVIDDKIAFCGGIDLSRWRWDTREHRGEDDRRIDPDGKPYPPFHDVMMLIEGEVAAALGELARERWRHSESGVDVPAVTPNEDSAWPAAIEAQFEDLPLAIARTYPEYGQRRAVREVEQLYLDAIASAQEYIYIENQYFTSSVLTDALAQRLAEPGGPEVVLVLPHHTGGWLEQVTMDAVRATRLKELREADSRGRFKVFYPEQTGLGEDECISVHSKMLIADDGLLIIGSANTSDRSMGLDSECNLAIDCPGSKGIKGLLHTLLAEHLDCSSEEFADARSAEQSVVAAIGQCNGTDGRRLKELAIDASQPPVKLADDADLVDPAEPLNPEWLVQRAIPESDEAKGHRGIYLFVGFLLVLAVAAAAWRWTPLSEWLSTERLAGLLEWFENPVTRGLAVTGLLIVASLLMVPLSVLVVLCAILAGPWLGFACAMAGALVSAWFAFEAGKLTGGRFIERFDGSQVHRLSEKLSERGIMAVAMLRLIPVAPFTIVNMVAGASHIRTGQFMVGSAIGLLPGIGALTVFSGTLYEAVVNPSPKTIGIVVTVAAVVAAGAFFLRRLLKSS